MSDATQPALFNDDDAGFKNCVRCHILCRVRAKVNPNANLFVKGTAKTGRFCANCLVVDFFKNCEIGPSSSLGTWFFDESIPIPEWERKGAKRFDPASLRDPNVRQQLLATFAAARSEYGAELTAEEIDWDEVIANWHLPFPEKGKGKKGGPKS